MAVKNAPRRDIFKLRLLRCGPTVQVGLKFTMMARLIES